jgi:hypothetical protein
MFASVSACVKALLVMIATVPSCVVALLVMAAMVPTCVVALLVMVARCPPLENRTHHGSLVNAVQAHHRDMETHFGWLSWNKLWTGIMMCALCVVPMDQISKKTSNSKCRPYWCLIELIEWRLETVSRVGIFDPLVNWRLHLTFSLVHLPLLPPPLPCVNKYSGMYSFSV